MVKAYLVPQEPMLQTQFSYEYSVPKGSHWDCPLCRALPALMAHEHRLFRGLEKPFLEEQLWGFLLCVILQEAPRGGGCWLGEDERGQGAYG